MPWPTRLRHEASVVAALPRLCPIELFRTKVAGWKKLSSRSAEFEDDVGVVCRLLLEGDERIGKAYLAQVTAFLREVIEGRAAASSGVRGGCALTRDIEVP